jgi:peptidoglycan/xylan/chitin deacetylase (PgdA/CDA1 family)
VADAKAIPILMYHHLTRHPPEGFAKYALSPKTFARQMKLLALAGYCPVSLDAWLANRHDRGALPGAPVIISFDDGFGEAIEHAVPVLKRHRFPAIFFLVAGLMGKASAWLMRERGVELPLLDWERAARLHSEGFEIGSHTITHPRLTGISRSSCYEELRGSRLMLEDRLGCPVRHLAYPFGLHNEAVRTTAERAGYVSGLTTEIGLARPWEEPHALRRVPVVGGESLLDFAARLLTGHALREQWGPALARLRSLVKFPAAESRP